ncbi:MAG: hypothetical protein ABIR96_00565 [Bdellovibrionota bacterium]
MNRFFLMLVYALSMKSFAVEAPGGKGFQAFRLPEARLFYRRPLLASGPAEGLQEALPAGTEILLVTATRNRDWIFVRTEGKSEGWIPSAWVQAPYAVNALDVRDRFYPEEIPPETGFDFSTDVKVWGSDLLLEALKTK